MMPGAGGVSNMNGNSNRNEDSEAEDREILIVDAPAGSVGVGKMSKSGNNNNPFLMDNGEVKENPFDQLDAITSALLSMTSTNPFHNPFLMPSEPQKGHGTLSSDHDRDDPGCTKLSPVPRVSLLLASGSGRKSGFSPFYALYRLGGFLLT